MDPGPFVICGFESYILTLFPLSYTCIYEIVIYTSQSGTFFYVFVYIYFVNIYLSYFSYQLKDSLMSLCLCYSSLLLCLVFYKYIYALTSQKNGINCLFILIADCNNTVLHLLHSPGSNQITQSNHCYC